MASLSLCIIVGSDEAKELERCLKSVQGPLFDEIIVVLTQKDKQVEEVARRYADKTPSFEWVDDFSAARNFSFLQASSSYIMWLDSDDEISPENYNKLIELKPELEGNDYVYMTYNYGHDDQGKPLVTLPRERIVKNSQNLRWHDPIHEYILVHASMKKLDRVDIEIDHRRTKPHNSSRNLKILRKEYEKGSSSPRIKFYFAKDLYESGEKDEAAVIFNEYLRGPTDFAQNKVLACLKMHSYYTHVPGKEDKIAAVSYLRKALTYHNGYAEVYYYLGLFYQENEDLDEAIALFRKAADLDPSGLFGAKVYFYGRYPLDRLTSIYFNMSSSDRSMLGKALSTVDEYLSLYPDDENYLHNKKLIVARINDENVTQEKEGVPKEDLKVVWLVRHFNPNDPSQRIRRLNIHHSLTESGYTSALLTNYHEADPDWVVDNIGDANLVVSSTFDEFEYSLLGKLKEKGLRVVVDLNEDITSSPAVQKILGMADGVLTCSSELLNKAKPFAKKLAVVEDAVEEVEVEYDHFTEGLSENGKPTALFMGMGGNSFLVKEHLRSVIEEAGYDLKLCTEWEDADIPWSIETWQEVMAQSHVVLCPQRVNVQPAKSNIKASQAMSFGIPVVASPLPAYKEFIEHGKNGYLCESQEEWKQALLELKDVRKRIQVGLNGKDTSEEFSLKNITEKWAKKASLILNSADDPSTPVAANPTSVKETVPIVIPVYNGLEYLKACITSIHMNTTYPYHIVLSDAGSNEETWEYLRTLKGITVIGNPGERKNFSEAVNAGIESSGNTRFFALLNSDVIVSRGWLANMVKKMETHDRLAVCGVLSNCDRGWLFDNPRDPGSRSHNMRVNSELDLHPGMKLEEVMPHIDDLNRFMEKSNSENKDNFIDQEWVAYYANVFARSAWEEVGNLDPVFKSGCEDLDHCRRSSNLGFKIGQSLDSFVFHFGGISRGAYQEEDKETYDVEDRYNHQVLKEKWEKKEVIIYTGPAWEPWNREDVEKGMAGSETWAAELSAELSKAGFRVTLFGNPRTEKTDEFGVRYMDFRKMEEYLKYRYISLAILSRTCEPPKHLKMRTDNLYVMVHDIWLNQDKNYDTMKWAINGFGVLSEWHDQFFRQHHGVEEEKTFLTFNGIRHENYKNLISSKKKNKTVYSSSPDRGLEVLLDILPRIREQVPDFEVDVAYGFHNWQSMAEQRGDQESLKRIELIKEKMKQPGVNYLGRISKKELADRQKEAKVWLYPTWFSETFCISCLENGMAGNAAITTPYAGMLTTMGDNAIYIKGPDSEPVYRWCLTKEYQDSMVGEAVKALTEEPYRLQWANRLKDKVSGYTWENAAKQWIEIAGL